MPLAVALVFVDLALHLGHGIVVGVVDLEDCRRLGIGVLDDLLLELLELQVVGFQDFSLCAQCVSRLLEQLLFLLESARATIQGCLALHDLDVDGLCTSELCASLGGLGSELVLQRTCGCFRCGIERGNLLLELGLLLLYLGLWFVFSPWWLLFLRLGLLVATS